MNGEKGGWKSYVGAGFMGLTVMLTGLYSILDSQTVTIIQAVTGGLGVFLTGIGIAHKMEKMKTAIKKNGK